MRNYDKRQLKSGNSIDGDGIPLHCHSGGQTPFTLQVEVVQERVLVQLEVQLNV